MSHMQIVHGSYVPPKVLRVKDINPISEKVWRHAPSRER
jgi:hypothetical protein